MAYTLNSAKDSLGDEDQYVAEFTARLPHILAAQRQYGGDLEGAYQRVTGKPWPAGRSVKLKDGIPVMTKDRTVKSVLGKYVLPIAAGVAAPYLLPLMAGGGGAAAGTAAATAGTGGTAGTLGSSLAMAGMGQGINMAANMYASRQQANASRDATREQLGYEDRAAQLEAKTAAEQLAFLREQEANRRAEFRSTQDKNFGLEQARLDRMAPYRRAGRGSLAQLLQPLAMRG